MLIQQDIKIIHSQTVIFSRKWFFSWSKHRYHAFIILEIQLVLWHLMNEIHFFRDKNLTKQFILLIKILSTPSCLKPSLTPISKQASECRVYFYDYRGSFCYFPSISRSLLIAGMISSGHGTGIYHARRSTIIRHVLSKQVYDNTCY